MIHKKNNYFQPKDSYKLSLTYVLGIQLVLPLTLAFIISIIGHDLLVNNPELFSSKFDVLLQFLVFSIGAIWLVWRYYEHLVEAFNIFKLNFAENIKMIFKYYLIAQFLNILINVLLQYGFGLTSASENQQAVESLLDNMPLLMAFVTVVYAPIIEEIVFRGGLYLGIRDTIGEKKASLLSAIAFGGIHIIPQVANGSLVELLYILPYSVLGYFMVKAVRETNSLFGGIVFHGLNNLIATLMVLLII